MRIQRRAPRGPNIDMTPMIDCVFQLLIFFMLSNSFQAPLIQLNLPRAKGGDSNPSPAIFLTVDAEGNFFLDQEKIDPSQLEPLLRKRIGASKNQIVTFRGDQKTFFQHFVRAYEAVQACGVAQLNIEHTPGQ